MVRGFRLPLPNGTALYLMLAHLVTTLVTEGSAPLRGQSVTERHLDSPPSSPAHPAGAAASPPPREGGFVGRGPTSNPMMAQDEL